MIHLPPPPIKLRVHSLHLKHIGPLLPQSVIIVGIFRQSVYYSSPIYEKFRVRKYI